MGLIGKLGRADRRAFDAVAKAHLPGLERVLPRLSRAADHSVLWFSTAAVLAASGQVRLRRAALRGVFAIGISSPLANLVGKQLFMRARPLSELVPPIRMYRQTPTSAAFPSGHSASAAAFATGVALEAPLSVALPVAAVAGAVALSRVYTGAHYPGDVVGGVLLGIAAGLITRTVWPTLPDGAHVMRIQPVTSWHSADSGLGRGKGVIVVINSRAGAVAKGAAAFRAPAPAVAGLLPRPFPTPITHFLAAELPDAEIIEVEPDDDLPAVLRAAADKAEVLAVMGGDGSVNAAAQAALNRGLPLLVIPGGTLNHFSRTLGIDTPAAAIAAYRKGRLARVDVGCIRPADSPEIIFLNASSLGAYTELVEQRRRMEDRIGKWPALAVAAVRVLKDAEPVAVSINGRPRHIWLMFIGNCAYRSRGTAPTWRERLDDGLLDIRLISTGRRVRRLRAFAAVVVGHLHLGREYRRWAATSLHLHAGPAPIRIAHDGELSSAQGTITITKWPRALTVFTCARAENLVHVMRPGSTRG